MYNTYIKTYLSYHTLPQPNVRMLCMRIYDQGYIHTHMMTFFCFYRHAVCAPHMRENKFDWDRSFVDFRACTCVFVFAYMYVCM